MDQKSFQFIDFEFKFLKPYFPCRVVYLITFRFRLRTYRNIGMAVIVFVLTTTYYYHRHHYYYIIRPIAFYTKFRKESYARGAVQRTRSDVSRVRDREQNTKTERRDDVFQFSLGIVILYYRRGQKISRFRHSLDREV